MKFILLILSFCYLTHAYLSHYYSETKCGYTSCPVTNSEVLNIHIVPHSHDDVGWLKTVDQYYYGSQNRIQHAGVQYIFDSVIQALLLNTNRRFIFVETAFFWKWWKEQSFAIKQKVQHLVNNGQLEFIGGAWSMNDEATTHYQSTIDQFTWGFRKLEESVGMCAKPKIGWQIDPFGHSREQASLFSQFGFDGFFMGRLDYRDKELRLNTKKAEFLWQGSESLGSSSRIFTSVLYNLYSTPPGFCFDVMCPDTPIVDNEKSPEYNAKFKAQIFLDFAKHQAKFYNTNNVLITMGGDFHYQDALSYFTNMDKLIKAIRTLDNSVKIFYSTPSCYVKAVNQVHKVFTLKTDDFFPYASDSHSYWTGYFTSRPTSKRMERVGNHILQLTKQLSAAAFANSYNDTKSLNPLREAMGVMQHHDAITGTEKQHVADDYSRMLHEASEISLQLAEKSLKKLYSNGKLSFKSCLYLNISQCEPTEQNSQFLITVFNPLSRSVSHYVRIPVSKNNYIVYNSNGDELETQIVPIFKMIRQMPGRYSSATHELLFRADNIPALGQRVFYVKLGSNVIKPTQRNFKNFRNIKLRLNKNFATRSYIFQDERVEIRPEILYYNSAVGNNMAPWQRSSGAYIFRPKEPEAKSITAVDKYELHYGVHSFEYFEQINSWLGRVTRVYEKNDFVELNWIVGPIPTMQSIGKEIIMRYHTNLNNKGVFYTDSNGREMIKRVRNFRSTFNVTKEEPVSLNYYPVTSKITITDNQKNLQVSILNDRAQGGSSLKDGDIELMVHRRILHDDAFGVDEALNENAYGVGLIATGKHYILVGEIENSDGTSATAKERFLAQEVLLEPWLFITPLDNHINLNFNELVQFESSILSTSLPSNIHILTLEPWSDGKLLLRLEHIFAVNEDSVFAKPVTINIAKIFQFLKVKKVVETTLGANDLKSSNKRLQWNVESDYYYRHFYNNYYKKKNNTPNSFFVNIYPMEIKTFILDVEYKFAI